MRTGPVARAMPKPSNQARTAGVERRVRIERVRTGSSADGVEVALAVVRAEGDQLEVPVLQRRGGAEQRRDLVDQLLVVALWSDRSPGHSPHFRAPSYIV